MRMGNLLSTPRQLLPVMSAKTPRLGVAHPTVVPGNHPGASDDEEPSDREEASVDGPAVDSSS